MPSTLNPQAGDGANVHDQGPQGGDAVLSEYEFSDPAAPDEGIHGQGRGNPIP